MKNREKTQFRHVDNDNNIIRVTKEGDEFYIGNTDERAEGKMCHTRYIERESKGKANLNPSGKSSNRVTFDEDDDYAYSSDDF